MSKYNYKLVIPSNTVLTTQLNYGITWGYYNSDHTVLTYYNIKEMMSFHCLLLILQCYYHNCVFQYLSCKWHDHSVMTMMSFIITLPSSIGLLIIADDGY